MRSWMIGFICGVLPVAYMASLPPKPVSVVLLGSALLILACSRGNLACFASGVLLGLFTGMMHGYQLLASRPNEDCELAAVHVAGTVSSLPRVTVVRDGSTGHQFEFRLQSVVPAHCSGPRTVMLSYYGDSQINPGEQWQFHTRLKRPWGLANPGSFNMQAWYSQSGIDATGTVKSAGAALMGGSGLNFIHHQLRQRASQRISSLDLSGDTKSMLRALTVADRSGMDSQLWRMFQYYGINHLLVISGLHIGLVAGLAFVCGKCLGRFALLLGHHRLIAWLPGLLTLLFATLYTALAGFSLSTSRALVMLASFVLASLWGRHSSSWNNLLLAAFAVLLLNPLAALGSGFWLSFGAVAWLLWLSLWQRGRGRALRLVNAHLAMSLLMIPLGGWWFGGASLVSAIANLFMVPLVGMFVVPLALLGTAFLPLVPDWGNRLLATAGWPLEQLVPLAKRWAEEGGDNFFWQFSPSLPGVLLAIVGLALLFVRPKLTSLNAAILLSLPLLLPRERSWDGQEYLAKLSIMDVGQGTAIVLQDSERAMIYDTGGGDPGGVNRAITVLLPYLQTEGISQLDTLVVSHADNDHSAGAATLLDKIPVRQLLYGGEFPGSAVGRPCRAGQAWRWASGITFQVLSPALETGLSTNNTSCVLQVQVGQMRLLFPGDIDVKRERAIVSYWRETLHSDWLLAAHHGSITSSSLLWLKYVQPGQVVFSAGYANAFGHPHPDVVRRSRGEGRLLFSTNTGGALEFQLDPLGVARIDQYRLEHRRYWF